MLDENNCCR